MKKTYVIMAFEERTKQIVSMRKQGKTYAKIATHFDIFSSRARQIFLKYQRERAISDKWPFYSLLSNRTRNSLRMIFGDEAFSNPIIVLKYGRKKVSQIQNIGKYSLKEIDTALERLGYIPEGEKW